MGRWLPVVLIVALGGLFFWGLQNTDKEALPSALIGKPAPEFVRDVLPMYRASWDDKISRSQFSGKPILLNFWASWCPPCRDEAPLLEKFWQAHKSQMVVLGIAVKDAPADSEAFAREYGMTFPSVIDLEGRLMIDYGVYGQPETFVIDKTGKILVRHVGPVNESDLANFLGLVGIKE